MKTEQQIFDMLDRFMEIDPKSTEIETTITALDWVLGRVDTEDIASLLSKLGYRL